MFRKKYLKNKDKVRDIARKNRVAKKGGPN